MEKLRPRKGGHSAPQWLSQDVHPDQCRCRLRIFVSVAFSLDHHLPPVFPFPTPSSALSPGSALGGPLGESHHFPEPLSHVRGQCSPGLMVHVRTGGCHAPSLFSQALSHPPSNPWGPCQTSSPSPPLRSALGSLLMHAHSTPHPPVCLAISCSFLDPSSDVPSSSKSPLFRSTRDPVDFHFLALIALFRGLEEWSGRLHRGKQWLS